MMDTQSLWRQTVSLPRRPPLEGHVRTQVAIIGGGMAGCLLGFRLANAGVPCVILEAGTVGSGQTGGTTAKVTVQHGLLSSLVEKAGLERVRDYTAANRLALAELAALAAGLEGDVGWRACPSYLYARPGGTDLRREAALEVSLGLPAAFTTATALPFSVDGAVRLDGQAVFHPLAFLKAITGGLEIYEHTQVTRIRGQRLWTPDGMVTAEKVVFACHYPFRNLPGLYFMKLYQGRDYVLGLRDAAELDGSYFGVDPGDLSLRNGAGLLLAGGGQHRTGHNKEGGRYAGLERQTSALWPSSQVVCRWSAQDCMTPDGIPYIGRFSPLRPDWYVATGFNRWGMTNSMAAAMILTDLLLDRENGFARAFDPRRHNGASAKGILDQTGAAVKGLTKQWFRMPPAAEIPPGQGGLTV